MLLLAATTACTSASVASSVDSTPPATAANQLEAGPRVLSAQPAATEVPNYGTVRVAVTLDADYTNAYDQREVALEAVFSGPNGEVMQVPGFWDGRNEWGVRFTPAGVGSWTYAIQVTDRHGTSSPTTGGFEVTPSESHGWLQNADRVDPSYSPHYLAHHDGTPWFGFGHADLRMSFGGYRDGGFEKIREMAKVGENFEMFWPQWTANFMATSHDDFSVAQMELIDVYIAEAEANNITMAYTIWIHQLLRTNSHPWGKGKWADNGFSRLTDLAGFFTDEEAWAWQENYYRYVIARWGYSTSIAMWQTVTEINGTESGAQTDAWHERVNAYFQEHDPYRHPTTATKSGGEDWPRAHAVMDVQQMHVYEQFRDDPIEAAKIMADWTVLMFNRHPKPNWIGEYGIRGQQTYPDTFHNANWATFAAGAATTPIEWNDNSGYGRFTPEMAADMTRFIAFAGEIPLVTIAPEQLSLSFSDPAVRGWGVGSDRGGVIWVQDFALEGAPLNEIMSDNTIRSGVIVTISDLRAQTLTFRPYNTWTGEWLEARDAVCGDGLCVLSIPDFSRDLALQLIGG